MKFVNPNRVIDQSRFHSFHGLLVFWLFLPLCLMGMTLWYTARLFLL
mgnify:CR=1 FL=1